MGERFKTSARTNSNSLAGAIAITLRSRECVEVQAVGAAAVNQTMKAVAIARGFLAPTGINLLCYPAFSEVSIDNTTKTAMLLYIMKN